MPSHSVATPTTVDLINLVQHLESYLTDKPGPNVPTSGQIRWGQIVGGIASDLVSMLDEMRLLETDAITQPDARRNESDLASLHHMLACLVTQYGDQMPSPSADVRRCTVWSSTMVRIPAGQKVSTQPCLDPAGMEVLVHAPS